MSALHSCRVEGTKNFSTRIFVYGMVALTLLIRQLYSDFSSSLASSIISSSTTSTIVSKPPIKSNFSTSMLDGSGYDGIHPQKDILRQKDNATATYESSELHEDALTPFSSLLLKCNKNDASNVLVTIQEFYDSDSQCSHHFENDTIFFHLGKGGGGTVQGSLSLYRIQISSMHTSINRDKLEGLRHGPTSNLIINVRDPVDRFVSAFNWRLGLLCHPGDTRKPMRVGAAERPNIWCQKTEYLVEEKRLLRETYKGSVNNLALSLCEDSPHRRQATKDFAKIKHSIPLAKWLDFLVEPHWRTNITEHGIGNLMVMPLEKQIGVERPFYRSHIRQVVSHLFQMRYGKEMGRKLTLQIPEDAPIPAENRHTSTDFHTNNLTISWPKLSTLGECCLTRFLERDYRLIQNMVGDYGEQLVDPLKDTHPVVQRACFYGNEDQQQLCRQDLRSMLARRARHLDRSRGSCAEVS